MSAVAEHLPKAGVVAKYLQSTVAEHLPKVLAVAEYLQSTVAEHLRKGRVGHMRMTAVFAVTVAVVIFEMYYFCASQEDRELVY